MTSGEAEWRCSEDAQWMPTAPGSDASQVPVCSPRELFLLNLEMAAKKKTNLLEFI